MRFYRLVGAHIAHQQGYQDYRDAMLVLLENVGGVFEYDYHAVATHMAAKGKQYNRLFVLSFPDQEIANQFFTNPEYQAIREQFFDDAVAEIEILATWQA